MVPLGAMPYGAALRILDGVPGGSCVATAGSGSGAGIEPLEAVTLSCEPTQARVT